ncbi:hypothetical protein C5612_12185 [Pseudomonas frederiksbergensis]|uniref:Uncharacterized protein n=1 Tax=Pseudomonas frederiksbergensis TaxID=104087 RepID=A0A2S8HN50_9PSED|nr:hypothetical protein C5612_12185 [Pseudomonas frederiksbergensis]
MLTFLLPNQDAEPVGAGLLAKAVCQVASMLTVPPSSRASPLPQGLGAELTGTCQLPSICCDIFSNASVYETYLHA